MNPKHMELLVTRVMCCCTFGLLFVKQKEVSFAFLYANMNLDLRKD